MTTFEICWKSHRLELGERTRIMGIVNVTPDSFSDGGHFFSHDSATDHGLQLEEDGADILDIGGESTRPFSEPVSADEEARRVVPVIERLAKRVSIPISVDTRKSEVAQRALDAGASMINDITAMRYDPGIAPVAAKNGVPIILMHMKGTPETMQVAPVYDDLMGEITAFLKDAVQRAVKGGIPENLIIVDPGIGFGKSFEHNLKILRDLNMVESLKVPILIGVSRKAFIRNILKDKEGKPAAPDSFPVETGSQAAVAAAILNGAHIVRVHNVANTVSAVKIIDAVKAAR